MTKDPDSKLAHHAARYARAAAARPAYWHGKDAPRKLLLDTCGKKAEQQLADILLHAQRSPTAQRALAWAQSHGVTIVALDRTPRAGESPAFYRPGEVHINCSRFIHNHDAAVGALVHEIRHAWQDYYGLLPDFDMRTNGKMPLAQKLILNAFYEADAYAHGELAKSECGLSKAVQNPQGRLRFEFMQWFDLHPAFYHERAVTRAANPVARALAFLFNASAENNFNPGGDWRGYLHKLGRGFDNSNYLAGMTAARKDELNERIMSPRSAVNQFDAKSENKDVSKARKLEKKDLRARVYGHLPKLSFLK